MNNSLRLFRYLPAIVGVTLLTSVAQAQVTKVGDAYQFHVKYHKGMTIKYVIKIVTVLPTMTDGAKPQSLTMSNPVECTVADVQNKIATLKVTSGPSTLNGAPQGTAQTLEIKVDDHGKPVGATPSALASLTPPLPAKPLKVGESFMNKQEINVAQMPISVHAVYKFVGFKSVHGHRNAEFTVTSTGSGSVASPQGGAMNFSTQGTGTMGISAEDGLMNFTDLDQDVILPQGAKPLKLKTKTSVERQ